LREDWGRNGGGTGESGGGFLLLVFIVLRVFRRERIRMITRGVRIGRRSLLLL